MAKTDQMSDAKVKQRRDDILRTMRADAPKAELVLIETTPAVAIAGPGC